jgi:hypothetical protein
MNNSKLLASGIAALCFVAVMPAYADIAPPNTGGTTSTTTTAVAGSGTTADGASNDDSGCSVALVRNTSAAAAGFIAVALALGMSRLRRYGMR